MATSPAPRYAGYRYPIDHCGGALAAHPFGAQLANDRGIVAGTQLHPPVLGQLAGPPPAHGVPDDPIALQPQAIVPAPVLAQAISEMAVSFIGTSTPR